MVQCETCNAWQHGLCMGYYSEADLPPGDYHCERCRPDLHTEILEQVDSLCITIKSHAVVSIGNCQNMPAVLPPRHPLVRLQERWLHFVVHALISHNKHPNYPRNGIQ
jgi:hypothetical protein